jgi:hypothetical protein
MSPPSPSSSTSKNAANYTGGRRRSHPLALTVDLSRGKWKVKRARGRRTETRSHPHLIVAMIRRWVSIPARRKGRAGVFPLPREPVRATRRRPEIAPVRRAQTSSGETNPSRVSPQPGCGVGFGRGWPGATSGQGRKQVRLQPMGARPTWANLTNTPQATWGGLRVPKGATGATGRRRARVEARARGGGGNGGGAARGGALGSEEMLL